MISFILTGGNNMPEQKDKISDNFNVVINKIQMSPQEETHFSQTFINRLIITTVKDIY